MIKLPKQNKEGRHYISYSQYNKWKNEPKAYIRSYFLGDRFEGNAYTDFGSLIGEALENDDYKEFTKAEQKVLAKVTRLDQFEREINWDLGEFVVNGYIDTNDLKKGDVAVEFAGGERCDLGVEYVENIVDYKTGDMGKVAVYEDDGYDQVTIYAGAIGDETGVLPTKGWVELIERTGNAFRGEELKLGKKVIVIPQDVSPKNVAKVKKNLIKVAKEISASYKVFNKLNAIMI